MPKNQNNQKVNVKSSSAAHLLPPQTAYIMCKYLCSVSQHARHSPLVKTGVANRQRYIKEYGMALPAKIVRPTNPSTIGYPHTLPIEVALRVAPIKEICEAYGLSKSDWDNLRFDPVFIADVSRVNKALQTEGMSFKLKAQLQAEELLKESWRLIHDKTGEVPPSVKADLIKSTWRMSGLDESKNKANTAEVTAALQININMG